MGYLQIGTPFIRQDKGRTQLVAEISETGKQPYELWYETADEYGRYFVSDRIDAFLVALLPYAMQNSLDILSDGTVSEKLELQISKFLMPVLTKYSDVYNEISISIKNKSDLNINEVKCCATGYSRGVDSFDTIKETLSCGEQSLTHLTFFNVGSHRSTANYTSEQSLELYNKRLSTVKKSSEIFGLPLIDVNSNLGEHLTLPYVTIHHFCSFSAVLALQKLFRIYYYSSGYSIDNFSIHKCDKGSAFYEPLLAELLSTESTTFYISGLNKTRLDKIKSISEFEPSYDNLNVCYYEDKNCGKCEKCLRTQLELMSIDKLELYKNSFDINKFEQTKDSWSIEYMLKHQNQSNYKEILEQMKLSGIKLTFTQKIKKTVYGIALKILKK